MFIKNKRPYIAVVLLGAALYGGYYAFFKKDTPQEQPAKLVEVVSATQKRLQSTVNVPATLKPVHQTTFKARSSGVLKKHYVQEGTHVAKGTLLAELDNDELLSEVEAACETAALLEINYQRQQKLAASKNSSQQNLEQARASLLQAKATREQAKDRLKRTQFYAPYEGSCGIFLVRPGAHIDEGKAVLTFYDPSSYALEIGVPESVQARLSPGASFESLGHKGKLLSVQPVIDPQTRMGLAYAEIPSQEAPPAALGSIVDVRLILAQKEAAVALPKSTVFKNDQKDCVYKIEDGKAVLSVVVLGLEGDDDFEVLEGVCVGDTVILKNQQSIWPTRPVKAYTAQPETIQPDLKQDPQKPKEIAETKDPS